MSDNPIEEEQILIPEGVDVTEPLPKGTAAFKAFRPCSRGAP